MFKNKNILVTGGTGSFGKKFILNILKNNNPKKVIIYSRDELKQSQMMDEFKKNKNFKSLRFFLGDVRDYDRLYLALQDVDYVVHAAALKQVPAAEYNPTEFIRTNIQGAENVIKASLRTNVKKVIALSTDKAVNPINLYGGTKLVSDKLFVSANNYAGKNNTLFSVVRYGNVAGSRGSVIPLFQEMSQKKEKFFPITDLNMTRFWITLSEGVNFVMKSFERMRGGEIFIPVIPSFRITDLAKAINPQLKIKVVGLRPGEKINELMCSSDEANQVIKFNNYFIILPSIKNFAPSRNNYLNNNSKEKGKFVNKDFEYSSGKNKFFNISELKKKIKLIND